ncbi:MAG TPA: hypothetical protein VKA46_14010 [Gemmataceae bacterium]|nr:hypothetical protein [Gemmataceae bacterium]
MYKLRDPDRLLFFALLALYVLPLWVFPFFPSQDGPTHLENAVILRDYGRPDRPLLRTFYTLSSDFDPNWFGHLALAGLMSLFPPLIAEKVLLTGYLVLLPLAARYALNGVRAGAGWLAVLTFPFAQHFLYHMGFHNFCYSLAVFFFVAGYWLRHADHVGVRQTLALAALVVLLYFCHLVAVVMAFMLIGTLALGWTVLDRRARRPSSIRLRLLGPAVAFVPALALGLAFVGRQGQAMQWEYKPLLLTRLLELDVLVSYLDLERLLSRLTFLGLLGLAAFVLWKRWRARLLEKRDLLLAVVALALVAYFTAPSEMSGGSFLNTRLSLFVFLFLILWLGAHPLDPRLKRGVQAAAALVALGLLGLHTWAYAEFNTSLKEYVDVASRLKPGVTVLPLTFSHQLQAGHLGKAKVGAFRHAAAYLTLRGDVVELENYEANTGYFPVRYRPELNPFDHIGRENGRDKGLQAEPPDVTFLDYRPPVDYVLLWNVPDKPRDSPAGAAIFDQLDRSYERVEMPPGLIQLWQLRSRKRLRRRPTPPVSGRRVAPSSPDGRAPPRPSRPGRSVPRC